MVRRMATALVAAAVGASVLAAAGTAYADPGPNEGHHPGPNPKITSIVVNPNQVVLKHHRDSETVSVTVRGVDIKSAQVYWLPKGHHWDGGGHGDGGHGGNGPWDKKDDEKSPAPEYKPVWFAETFSKTIGWKDAVGSWSVRVVAEGVDGRKVFGDSSFFVKHVTWTPPKSPKGTRFVGFNASPEPVKQGRKLSLQGRLQVAQCYGDHHYKDPAYVELDGYPSADDCYEGRKYWHGWYRLGWQDIDVYFLPKGSHKWRYVDTIETNPDGTFYTKVKALKSGTWGVRFDGNRDLAGSEAYDYVKVVKK
jgi:hypothetical protein